MLDLKGCSNAKQYLKETGLSLDEALAKTQQELIEQLNSHLKKSNYVRTDLNGNSNSESPKELPEVGNKRRDQGTMDLRKEESK